MPGQVNQTSAPSWGQITAATGNPTAQTPSGVGSSSSAPGLPSGTSPWSLQTDPSFILAQNIYNQSLADAQAGYNLTQQYSGGAPSYTSTSGIQSAQLAYQNAQAQAALNEGQLAHDLPLTILKAVNGLAAHGLGYSGDASFLPAEATYSYNQNLANIQQGLNAAQAQIKIAQSDYAAAAAANAASHSYESSKAMAEAALQLQQAQQSAKDQFGQAVIQAYQQAASNPAYTISGDPTALLKSIGLA